ncbi:MAG: protein GlmU [Desulfamplus sp.]|nr:protein GlmU [Desulfamplus sp.]
MNSQMKIKLLIDKGVKIPIPESVFIDEDVDLSRIAIKNVILYPGTKIMGKDTLIMADTTLSLEAPVTIDNVFVGTGSRLNGGFFQKCAFAGQNSFGSGAHVREGTILEEGASAAHTAGLKQTILFPFVTLGSLINFCDCLMAGGTSRKDHSEVGSSFIHFNYTPNQDKATPSMLGNVCQGVMLKSRPVFLGGQGGLVGPCRLSFGSVTAAGTIWRKDITEPDRLMFGGGVREAVLERKPGVYSNARRIFENNILYIAGLTALMSWYIHIRSLFTSDFFSEHLLMGMKQTLESAIDERINRLDDFVKRLLHSKELVLSRNGGKITPVVEEHNAVIHEWHQFQIQGWHSVQAILEKMRVVSNPPPEMFISAIQNGINQNGRDYIKVIQSLDASASSEGSRWLESVEKNICVKI